MWSLNLARMHVAGNTDQAKADLGRLAMIKAECEAAQAKRKAEAEGVSTHFLGFMPILILFCS